MTARLEAGGGRTAVMADEHRSRVRVRHAEALPPQSKPPIHCTTCAATRAFARHEDPAGDALLLWYRSHGRERIRDVEAYLARRALLADWPCDAAQAVDIIRWAMAHVRAGRTRTAPVPVALRDDQAQGLRSLASAWLRAGIMEAEYRYGMARE